jgi:hypothetical protein
MTEITETAREATEKWREAFRCDDNYAEIDDAVEELAQDFTNHTAPLLTRIAALEELTGEAFAPLTDAALRPENEALKERVAELEAFIVNPPKHKFWMPGEPDCPRELKAGNGELHTLRCKVCGDEGGLNDICRAATPTNTVLGDISDMMSEFVEYWPAPKKVSTAIKLIAKTLRANWNEAIEAAASMNRMKGFYAEHILELKRPTT